MILAFDTSCYTSSVALMAKDGQLLSDQRRVLAVPAKKRGLLQSEALFQHINNIPVLLETLAETIDFSEIKAIGCSVKPRPVEKSYMPVFLGGETIGRSIAAAINCPFIPATHQEGHMMAGWYSLQMMNAVPNRFLLCHFSGGTSEILLAEKQGHGDFSLALKAFGNDLHAGQFVDRIGVLLGLQFPCGMELEKLALGHKGDIPDVKIWVKDGEFSFSGQETAIRRMVENGVSRETVARTVEHTIAKTMVKVFRQLFTVTGITKVLFVGGVMCNGYIKQYLQENLKEGTLYFADSRYASDNAVGVAALTLKRLGGN
jgi:N6-L-threonylcarbamoyladenine synthase